MSAVRYVSFAMGAIVLTAAAGAAEPPKETSDARPAAEKPSGVLNSPAYAPADGKARTAFFGLVGEGYKFVYVFDRSGSMSGDGRRALRAVKAELLDSLEKLDSVHQFQIVYYNQTAKLFNPSGQPGHLAFATEANKRRVARFLDGLAADGGTNHEDALRAALRLRPDVIFFLTDGDEPALTAAQLATIRRQAAGIVIHAIEFGPGPKPAQDGFLAALARQNGGEYVYVDISQYALKPE